MITLDSATVELQRAIVAKSSVGVVQQKFYQARLLYKRIEWLTEAYYPVSAKQLNGPAVPEGDVDDGVGRQIDAQGFQVLEELLFPYAPAQQPEALAEIAKIRKTINTLWRVGTSIPLTDPQVFDAIRMQLFRISALSISGYDSPIAQHSLPEAAESLRSLKQTLFYYPIREKVPALYDQINQLFFSASSALQSQTFNNFDRLAFIRIHANPLAKLLLEAQLTLKFPSAPDRRLLLSSAGTFYDENSFNPYFFAPFDAERPTPERIALGKMLFSSTLLTTGAASTERRSCASCHQPERAFTDGQSAPFRLGSAHDRIARNTPTLYNAGLQQFQFLDARALSIEELIGTVLTNPHEMGGSWPLAIRALSTDSVIVKAFGQAYPSKDISKYTVTDALAHYIRSLVSLNARFDRYMRYEAVPFSRQEQLGFNLFMGKAKCATCHFFPLFNGTIPPTFTKTESEVIGTPANALEKALSADSGRYYSSKLAIHLGAFKTPTLRHIVQTAPYMHNGAYQTLEQVIDFYDKGGGQGLGFQLENQTLPADPLRLTKAEKKALVAFLKTL